MWCQLDEGQILGPTRNQDVRTGRVVRVVMTFAKARVEVFLRMAGWMVRESWYSVMRKG